MPFKALLLDVDGTIVPVGPNTKPSLAVQDTLKKAQEQVPVCIVSGRCLEWLEELFEILDLSHPCIINGGSQIVDPKTKEILWEMPISTTSMDAIMLIIQTNDIPYIVSDDGIEYKDPPYSSRFSKPLAVKLTYFKSKEISDRCLMELFSIPNISAHKVTSWDKDRKYRLELYITHRDATKARAAQELAHLLGISPSEMIGVGDARNDIPLLDACGLKVAMRNADDKLKSVADYIAPSVEEDGVAHVARHFVLG